MPKRDLVLKCVGKLPQLASSLKLEIDSHSTIEKDNCSITKIYYNVENDERVYSYLLMPLKDEISDTPLPVVIAIHQHGGQFDLGADEPAGLKGDPVNHFGLRLCKRGYAVFCPELLCFRDRRPSAEIRHRHSGRMEAHGYENHEFFKRLLNGSTLQAKYLHDLSVAIDVIEKIPRLDSRRIAAFGQSLGGQEALWLGWFDSRVKVVVASCGICTLKEVTDKYIVHNKAMYLPNLLNVVEDLHEVFSPDEYNRCLPTFISAGVDDFMFPIEGTRYLVNYLQSKYQSGDNADKFEYQEFKGGHEFPMEVQEKAFTFVSKWL